MSDLRLFLEGVQRQVRARPGSLDKVLTRHRRRRRNQTLTAAAVALSLAAGGVFISTQAFRAPGSSVPASPLIGPSNVGELSPAWETEIAGIGSTSPTLADGVLYAASTEGSLYALDARTGTVRWIGATEPGVVSQPAVMGGSVFVQSGGRLFAFDVGCARAGDSCSPRWSAPTQASRPAPIVASDGVVYAASLGSGLMAFPATCDGATCDPLWRAGNRHQIASEPAVSDDVLWYSGHALVAFPVDCRSGGEYCEALGDPIRPDGMRVTSGPTLAGPGVYVGTSEGSVHALATACAEGGSCETFWSAKTRAAVVAAPAVGYDRVFVASTDGRLYAFPTSCDAGHGACEPLWTGRTDGAIDQQPLVANEVVYATSSDGNLYAFSEACGISGAICAPLLVEAVGALPPSPVIWANRVIFVTSRDGTATAFTVRGSRIS